MRRGPADPTQSGVHQPPSESRGSSRHLANHYYRWNTAVAEVFVSGHDASLSTLAEPGSPA